TTKTAPTMGLTARKRAIPTSASTPARQIVMGFIFLLPRCPLNWANAVSVPRQEFRARALELNPRESAIGCNFELASCRSILYLVEPDYLVGQPTSCLRLTWPLDHHFQWAGLKERNFFARANRWLPRKDALSE